MARRAVAAAAETRASTVARPELRAGLQQMDSSAPHITDGLAEMQNGLANRDMVLDLAVAGERSALAATFSRRSASIPPWVAVIAKTA